MKKAWHQQTKRLPKESRTDRDGTVFHSKGEMIRWHKLRLWQLAGHIRNLRRQVHYTLQSDSKGVRILTETGKTAVYTADFVYEKRTDVLLKNQPMAPDGVYWETVIEDFKLYRSRESMFRIRVFEALYDCKVTVTRR